jgi:hypothetical protein
VKLILVTLIAASLGFGQQARKITPSKPVKATPVAKTTPKATPAKKFPVRATPVRKSAYRAPATKANRVAAGRYKSTSRTAARVAYTQSPSAERYREIQQALADKGYYTAEADGAWDAASIDALNRFKTDQKLKADGKLCSLSLIALGLGPKYEAVTQDQLPAPPTSADQQ